MRRKGATITYIVSAFGHDPTTIKKALDEWGVVPEVREKRHNAASKRTKKKVKSFPSIDDCARRATELGMSYGAFTDGVDMGNILEFRRMDMVRDGKHIQLPVVSGNAFRGIMRRLLAREFFEMLDLKNQLSEKEHDRLYAVLANGGALGKDLDVRVDPNAIREMREKLPLLSVFGAACYRYIIPGMFNCGFLELLCSEAGTGDLPISELTAEIGETHHIDKSMFDSEKNDIKPMPYTTEVVVKGAEFSASIDFMPHTAEAEKSAIYHGLKLINFIGGKSARGYGKVKIECDCELNDSVYLDVLKNTDIDFLRDYIRSIL